MMDELGPDCAPIEACLPLMVGGELEQPLAEQVHAHVERCARCRGSLRALESALAHLAGARRRVDPQVNLWPALERELISAGRIVATPTARASDALGRAPVSVGASEAAAERSATSAGLSGRSNWLRRAAFLAAAASLALVAWRMTRPSAPGSGPSGVQRDFAVAAEPRAGVQTSQAGAPSRGEFALVGNDSLGGALGAPTVGANSEQSLAVGPLSVPVGAGAAGLRRLGVDEPLLRDSIDPHGSGGDYSLAGSRGLR